MGMPPPSPSQLLTWGEGAGGDRGSHEVSGGDKSWGQKYTRVMAGEGWLGNPPTQPHCWGDGETPGPLPPLWCFPGEGSSEMGRPETSNMEGASGAAGEEGEGVRCRTRVAGEGKWRRGHRVGGGQARGEGLGRRRDSPEGSAGGGGRTGRQGGGWKGEGRGGGRRGGVQDLRVENPVSPIGSSHHLSSMNAFWHFGIRGKRSRDLPPTPTHPSPTFPSPPHSLCPSIPLGPVWT